MMAFVSLHQKDAELPVQSVVIKKNILHTTTQYRSLSLVPLHTLASILIIVAGSQLCGTLSVVNPGCISLRMEYSSSVLVSSRYC